MRSVVRTVSIVLVSMVLALLAVSAGWPGRDASAATGPKVTVRPFEEVQANEMKFERDPADPSRGIFRVRTTEPMICAIVWGPDESFGRFNNSLAMNGTGLVDHNVLLPDVAPGVTYSYVVQGTTADGTLYRSKVGTFRLRAGTPIETPETVKGLPNAALGATVVDASSEFSTVFAAANAIDGDPRTEWATKGDGDRGSITLDLGQPTRIEAIEFVTRSMGDGSATTSRYTVSVDGGAPMGPYRAGTLARTRPTTVTATGQLVRFDVARSTGGNVGAVEIRVYAAAP